MSSDERTRLGSPGFSYRGTGSQTTWLCMGCNLPRINLGAKGRGIARRCASCVAARAAPKNTVLRSQLSNLRMTTGGEKELSRVVLDGHVKFWVGIGWVDEGKATAADRAKYPTVVEG